MMDHDPETNEFNSLADAMEALAPPPCETIGPNGTKCPLYSTCATKFLACPEYFYYVHETKDATPIPAEILDALPTREVYNRVYSQEFRPSLHPTRWISDGDKALILSETGSVRDVALQYKCSEGQVRVIRARNNGNAFGGGNGWGSRRTAADIFENSPRMGSVREASSVQDRNGSAV